MFNDAVGCFFKRHHPGDRFLIVPGKGAPILAQLTPDSFGREPKLDLYVQLYRM